ncbi:MAG: DNA replication/repair protein RecF [Rudaea sp.]|uniref:DNA replication/repair protein RecF n=1 Tax=Rudaea sp. TaxID=2136325 RepID=UPI0039E41DFF
MHLTELRIQNLRNIEDQRLELAAGLNVFVGPNGAGKTSFLEAAYVLSHGSSFRTHQSEHLQRRGTETLALYAQARTRSLTRRLGLLRRDGHWTARLDGEASARLVDLFAACAVVCFEPGSHALIAGAADGRRSFLDWGVFHVEHDFAAGMRRYRRALRQRNALLKQEASDEELAIWDEELSQAAEPLGRAREAYMERFGRELVPLLDDYLPELGGVSLRFRPGWNRDMPLGEVLKEVRQRDRALGHTTRGPHRADWGLVFANAPSHEQLSRGQEKLCAIACTLAQVSLYRSIRGENPVIAFDDLCSELDAAHQAVALAALTGSGAQILLTGTEIPSALLERFPAQRLFHVEQGKVRAVL